MRSMGRHENSFERGSPGLDRFGHGFGIRNDSGNERLEFRRISRRIQLSPFGRSFQDDEEPKGGLRSDEKGSGEREGERSETIREKDRSTDQGGQERGQAEKRAEAKAGRRIEKKSFES